MAFVVTEACVNEKNKSCIEVCPVDCIYTESDALDKMVFIDPDECIDCGACESACPVNAIYEDVEVPEESHEFVGLNRRWFVEKDDVRGRLEELTA